MSKSKSRSGLIPVILSGGAGTRLWPVSRRAHPKPFMELVDGETLAEKTLLRAKAVAGDAPVITVTSRDYYFYTRDLYSGLKNITANERFLLEPMGRNTAPAIALAAMCVRDNVAENASLLVLPADHLIADLRNFKASVREAVQLSNQGFLVTFGIHPTHAETGYGYIRQGEALTMSLAAASPGLSSKSSATFLTVRARKNPPTIMTAMTITISTPQPMPTHANGCSPLRSGVCAPLLIPTSSAFFDFVGSLACRQHARIERDGQRPSAEVP
jgi:hypothetical protein